MPRSPSEIMADIDAIPDRIQNGPGISIMQIEMLVWEVINDIRSSYRLAMTGVVDPERLEEIQNEVGDYASSHYDSE